MIPNSIHNCSITRVIDNVIMTSSRRLDSSPSRSRIPTTASGSKLPTAVRLKNDNNIIEKIKVIVSQPNLWEVTFLKELLPEGIEIIYSNPQDFIDINFYKRIDIYKHYCILVFTSNIIKYEDIKKISTQLKPCIIFHYSDEMGHIEQYLDLANDTNLLLRQYYHKNYITAKNYNNIEYIPLGYMANEKITSSLNIDIIPIHKRNYTWSFVGDYNKTDRKQMIDSFVQANFDNFYINNNLKPEMMFDIYKESIFIPVGHGNIGLNCFRIYEASMCGAIPIIVGNIEEIQNTFEKENNPPWIFSDSWDNAVEICKQYLNNENLLIDKQTKILDWYKKRILEVKNKINNVINVL
jgi:hypothetical protein